MLILLTHEHGIWLHLYILKFLSSVSPNFSGYMSFTFLFKHILRYFILFEATVNGIVLLISDSLLLAYKNTPDF